MIKQPQASSPVVLRLRIKRLVVNAGVLGDVPRDRLGDQVQSALAARLSEAAPTTVRRDLAGHIADAVAPQVRRHLPAALPQQAATPRRTPSP